MLKQQRHVSKECREEKLCHWHVIGEIERWFAKQAEYRACRWHRTFYGSKGLVVAGFNTGRSIDSDPFFDKLILAQLITKFHAPYRTRMFISVLQDPVTGRYLLQMNAVRIIF
jgi:hypothetical protein